MGRVSGGQTFDTTPLANLSHGFTGWQEATFDYTATSTSESLAFLAVGNLPVMPFAWLDGVDLEDVSAPEPSAFALLGCGLAGGLGFLKTRKQK